MHVIGAKKQRLIVEHTLDIGKFKFYSNIIIGEFNEGVHVSFENAMKPIRMAQTLYKTYEPVVYISHRVHSYSMDPTSYKKIVGLFPNFLGFAIVSSNTYRRMMVYLEKLFIHKPTSVFYDMDRAFLWAENLLEDHHMNEMG